MGTRATISFRNEWNEDETICTIYWQYDGYIENGRGEELFKFLRNIEFGNGICGNPNLGEYANGMGDLVCQYIRLYKNYVGNMYIIRPIQNMDEGKKEDRLQEYNYIVKYNREEKKLMCDVYNYDGKLIDTMENRGDLV